MDKERFVLPYPRNDEESYNVYREYFMGNRKDVVCYLVEDDDYQEFIFIMDKKHKERFIEEYDDYIVDKTDMTSER